MISATRLLAIIKKELRQLRRDRLTFAFVFGLPLMQILLFGYAINTDVRHIRTAIANEANTQLSREFVAAIAQSQVVDIVEHVENATRITDSMRRGDISIGIVIPHDFDRRVALADRIVAQLLVDGSDPTVLGVANQLLQTPIPAVVQGTRQSPVPRIETRAYYNPERRSPVYIVPGLIGVILMMTMMLFTAVAIVRERERGNLELLINTPVSSAELMIGKVAPYIVIGLLQLALILAIGRLLFEVPVRGSLLHLYAAGILFISAKLSLGLMISTAAKTQFQAMQMTVFILLPSILLSGFMFPFDGMPAAARWIGEALPTTHFIRLTRGIMLREADLLELTTPLVYLAAFTLAAMCVAALRFSKRLD